MAALSIHRAHWNRLRISNPFTVKIGGLLAIMLGILIAGTVTIDNLKWIAADGDYWVQLVIALFHNILLAGLLFAFCFVVYGRCVKRIAPSASALGYALTAAVGSLTISFVVTILSRLLRQMVFSDFGIVDVFAVTMINDMLVAVAVILISTLLSTLTRRQQAVLENEKLQSEQLITRYETLEQQVNPHFLFNSLNTLGGLIGVDDDKASRYLQQLASAYRYVMQQHEDHMVTLGEEMEFVDTFFDMMQTRYGDNLKMDCCIGSEWLSYRVPPISVQLLIENAIKHNVVSSRHPLTISLAVGQPGVLRVSNPLQPKQAQSETESSHVGLENLSQRYQMLFHTDIVVSQSDKEFVVELPLIKQ